MKFKVTGQYNGKVEAIVTANSLVEALIKLENADEDSLEILEPSKFTYVEKDVK